MLSRRTFVSASAALAAAAHSQTASATPQVLESPYDFAAIQTRLGLPFPHRQAFGSARLADGAALHYMLNSLNAYQFDYGEGPGTLHAVGIFYGSSTALLLDDAAWRTYRLATVQQRRGDPAATAVAGGGNPFLRAQSALDPAASRGDLHGLYHDASVAALFKRGASFLACDNALRGLATDIAVSYALSSDPLQTVHADLRAHLIAGVLLVPAGVAAVNQAQEMKFTFVPASV